MTTATQARPSSVRYIVLAAALGLVLLLGGPMRVSGPSYHFIASYGGCYAWGGGFLVVGVVMMIAALRRRPGILPWAFYLASIGYCLFALACLGSALSVSASGLTGIVTYSWLSFIHVWRAVELRQ